MKKKLKIITAYDSAFAPLGDICAATIKTYSAFHDFDYEIYKQENFFGRHPQWAKIALLKQGLIANNHEYILWIDADAFFVSANLNILEEPNLKDFNIVNHQALTDIAPNHLPGVKLVVERPNTGVILVKNSSWSLEFLDELWNCDFSQNHHWRDNAAVMKALGFTYEISGYRIPNSFNFDSLSNTNWLNTIWNAVPAFKEDGTSALALPWNPMIVHLAGMPNNKRFELLKNIKFNSFNLL
jgi:hypothetical protein